MQTIDHPQKMLQEAKYVASRADLINSIGEMEGDGVLSIDTEFIRERTYFPQLCLIQVANKKRAWCLDAIAIEDLSPFFELCQRTDLVKILHSARQDMEIFSMNSDSIPMPIFDTQIAATFLGRADQISYAALVEEIFGVKLDKSQSRTNWVARPLRQAQINYALNDVIYLEPMYDKLREKLEEKQRWAWFEEDSQLLGNPDLYTVKPQDAWQKVKGAGHLGEAAFKCMMALAEWRETTAKKSDLPRSWVVKDPALIFMAENAQSDFSEFEKQAVLTSKQIRRWGDDLREILDDEHDKLILPSYYGTRGLDATQKKLFKKLSACIKAVANDLELQPSLLANRRQLERVARGNLDVPLFNGGRAREVGGEIRSLVQQ